MNVLMEKKHYDALDGLRTIACTGIVMMHIRANNTYEISGFIYNKMIASFTNFVFLFMVISAFGMCCGYLDKILANQILLENFYIKRYSKILPFFSVLILLDVLISPSKVALIEGFADMTLLFGFFPNNISVIGVGWFLGLIFAFYIIFPFYCVLIQNRTRAWGVFAISLLLNNVCDFYFKVNRANIIYSLCYLIAGGLIYLYCEELEQFSRKYRWINLGIVIVTIILYYLIGENTLTILFVSVTFLIYALGRKQGILRNRFTKFFSSVSMEIYLSHMIIFRAIEKIGINKIIGNGWIQYVITVLITLVGSIVFATVIQKVLGRIGKLIS